METARLKKLSSAVAAVALGIVLVAGCNQQKSHPDEKSAVTNALGSNNLGDVNVSQDQDKGVMTLSGNVQSDEQKMQAEKLAKQAAPDYQVANEIGVRPAGATTQAASVASNIDDGIEANFKAAIKGHKNLDDQDISAKAKNGTVELTGSVKTNAQKAEAEKLAKKVPNVQQVVNELKVEPRKHSTAASNPGI